MRMPVTILGSILSLFRGSARRLSQHRGPRDRGAASAGEVSGALTQVQDEGIDLTKVSVLDFQGAGVAAAVSGGAAVVTIPGSADDDYDTVQDRGAVLGARTTLNAKAPLFAEDDAGNTRTNIGLRGFAEPNYRDTSPRITHYVRFISTTAPNGWAYASPGAAAGAAYDLTNGVVASMTTDTTGAATASVATSLAVAARDILPEAGITMRSTAQPTNTRAQVGLMSTVGCAGTEQGAYFRDAGGNWIAVTRGASGETTSDTGVAPSGSEHQCLVVEAFATGFRFYIDGVLVATHTTNLIASTTAMFLAATAKVTTTTTSFKLYVGSAGIRHEIHA